MVEKANTYCQFISSFKVGCVTHWRNFLANSNLEPNTSSIIIQVEKANTYCQFISSFKVGCVDKKLVERCKNYIENVINFHRFKSTFNQVNNDRRERESWLDMRHMRLNGI